MWDVDGNEYIDYAMALGPIILGHNYPTVTDAVTRQMQDGTIFSLPHPLEVEVAELLIEIIPCAEMVRFGKNGSDATSGSVRVRPCLHRARYHRLLWLPRLAGLVHRHHNQEQGGAKSGPRADHSL